MATQVDRTELRAELKAITPYPWTWGGNTDNHSVSLDGYQPGIGVCEVLSTITVERDPDGLEARTLRDQLADVTEMTEDELDSAVQDWAYDEEGSRRSDERLALADPTFIRRNVEELVVYKVARNRGIPDDTPRTDPRVYRADVCDVRNLNGRFIASAPVRIEALLDLLDEQDRVIADLRAQIDAASVDVGGVTQG